MSSTSPQPRVALVTGATRGIGAAIAQALAHRFLVVGTATTQTGCAQVRQLLAHAPHGADGMVLRIEDDQSVNQVVGEIEEKYGAPLVLINNAGITRDNLALRMKISDWNAVIDTNLNGSYRLCAAVLRGMVKARWGRIVNLSSVVARMGNGGQTNYAAAKAGIEGLTRALAREIASRGITVNAIAPGFIETDMTQALSESQQQAMKDMIPAGRFGSVADVAALADFLVSEGAGYITGETIAVNGGMYMH